MKLPKQLVAVSGMARAAVLAGLAVLLGASQAPGATKPMRWRWSNPRPHGGNVVDMTFASLHGVAIQVAERGQVFTSPDLNLWFLQETGVTNDLRAVAAFGSRILVTGQSGCVLYADTPEDFKTGTLTSGATGDWLEAVTASPLLAVAVGDNGAVYTSTNGAHWKRQASGTTMWLRGVSFGGGSFIAVGENGKVIASSNGTNWQARMSGTTENLNRVTFAFGRFTSVAENGTCIFSTNSGLNWSLETTGATNDLFHMLHSGGTRLVVGDSEVRLQENGGAWTDEIAQTNGPTAWTYYSAIRPDTSFLIAGRTGLMEEGYRTNSGPHTWVASDESVRNWLWDVTNPTNLFVAVGDRATVMTSGNGVNWKLEAVPEALTNSIFLGVNGTPQMLVAAGDRGSLMISPNVLTNYTVTNLFTNSFFTNIVVTNVTENTFGVLWHRIVPPTTNDLQGVGVSDSLLVVTGEGGVIITSPDGTNWTLAATPTNRFLSSVTSGPRGWVATGDDGAILTSNDGAAWSIVPPVTTNWLYRVRYLGGRLIAVGQNGTILTSTNGLTWLKQTSGTTKWLNDVEWIDNTWFAVGNAGTVLTSTNAQNWSDVGTISRKNLYGAAVDGNQLVAVGVEGAILRSSVIPDLTPPQILAYDRVTFTNLFGALTQNIYLFGGRHDQQFTLDHRASFGTNLWTTGPQLEFFDGSGTLYYLETLTTTNPPAEEYYRATLVAP